MKLYMFRAVPLSIIRSLFTVHSAMVYVIQVCRQLSSRSICSCSKAVYKPVWHIPVPSVQLINSWWWTEELPESCRVSCRSKFGKLVHLVGFIIKKFVTMHGHMNVKLFCVICFLLGSSPASEFYMPTFRNTLSAPSSQVTFYYKRFLQNTVWKHISSYSETKKLKNVASS